MSGRQAGDEEDEQADPEAFARLRKALADIKPVQSKLAEVDWNFSNCPSAQLLFCQTYEYGRSSPAMLKRVGSWRQEEFAEADQRIISNYQLSAVQPMDFFRLFPEFPQMPWLALDPSVVAQRLKSLPTRTPILVRSLPVDSLRDYGQYQDSVHILEAFRTTTIQPLEVNWFFPRHRAACRIQTVVGRKPSLSSEGKTWTYRATRVAQRFGSKATAGSA